MKVITLYENFDLCLLDWAMIERFWQKNLFHPLDRRQLVSAFNRSWFKTGPHGEMSFIAGAVTYDSEHDAVLFVNGRHRTNLLLRYSMTVPVAVNETILHHPVLQQSVIETTKKELEVELPRLPIFSFPFSPPDINPTWFDNLQFLCG